MATLNYERYKKYYLSLAPTFKKPVNQAYTTIIFSFLAISLFGWYAIRPTMQTIFELKREIADKTDIDRKMEDKISALIEAQAIYEELQPSIPIINAALPAVPDPIRAIVQLKRLAEESQITFLNMSVPTLPLDTTSSASAGLKTTTPNISEYLISLTLAGPYPNIREFLTGVLDMRRQMQIESVALATRREASQVASGSALPTSTQVTVDLKLKLFYLTK